MEIERASKKVKINIFTAKPGMVIGKGGQEIDAMKKELEKLVKDENVLVNIVEVKTPG